jgi:hypothetical protein
MIYTARSGVQNQHEYLEKAWYWGVPIVAALIIVVMLLARMWTADPSSVGATYPDQANKTYTVPSANNTAPTPSTASNPPVSAPTTTSNSNSSTPAVSPGPVSSTTAPLLGSASSTPVVGGRGGVGPTSGGGSQPQPVVTVPSLPPVVKPSDPTAPIAQVCLNPAQTLVNGVCVDP